jgi:hypothetical protein
VTQVGAFPSDFTSENTASGLAQLGKTGLERLHATHEPGPLFRLEGRPAGAS